MSSTALFERVDVPAISQRARSFSFGHFLVLLIASSFFAVGWVLRKTLGTVWFAAVFCAFMLADGWQQAGKEAKPVPRFSRG